MASLLIPAENLVKNDVLLLPMGRKATVLAIKPVGPRTRFVQLRTEYGWTRVEVGTEVFVEPRT